MEHTIIFNACSKPDVGQFLQIGNNLRHTIRTLCKNLICMPRRISHHFPNVSDEVGVVPVIRASRDRVGEHQIADTSVSGDVGIEEIEAIGF